MSLRHGQRRIYDSRCCHNVLVVTCDAIGSVWCKTALYTVSSRATVHNLVMISLFTMKFHRPSASRPNACKQLERVQVSVQQCQAL